jgi:hypothetical protein
MGGRDLGSRRSIPASLGIVPSPHPPHFRDACFTLPRARNETFLARDSRVLTNAATRRDVSVPPRGCWRKGRSCERRYGTGVVTWRRGSRRSRHIRRNAGGEGAGGAWLRSSERGGGIRRDRGVSGIGPIFEIPVSRFHERGNETFLARDSRVLTNAATRRDVSVPPRGCWRKGRSCERRYGTGVVTWRAAFQS